MKSASVVVTFHHIIVYIHDQCAKGDPTLRKLSNWNPKETQTERVANARKERRDTQRNFPLATRAENKERINWRERAATPFEGRYSKCWANLKRSWWKTHAGGRSESGWSCTAAVKKKKSVDILKCTFREGNTTRLMDYKVPFYENMGHFWVTSNQKVEMHHSRVAQGRKG